MTSIVDAIEALGAIQSDQQDVGMWKREASRSGVGWWYAEGRWRHEDGGRQWTRFEKVRLYEAVTWTLRYEGRSRR